MVGINLLREGLDLPEVSLVAVLDSDKEGFLRSKSSLLQTAGRAARHVKGMVILYGDKQTDAIKNLIEITSERRKIQEKYNQANKIEPKTISKDIDNIKFVNNKKNENKVDLTDDILKKLELGNSNSKSNIKSLEKLMLKASDELKFEKAAELRDRIRSIKEKSIGWKLLSFLWGVKKELFFLVI